jgi:hypothetical protein
MELSLDQWHVRLYLWSRETWLHFLGKNFSEIREKRTDLCTYIRTLFVWIPIVFLAHIAVFGWLGYVFLYLPITTYDMVPLGIFLAKAVGMIVGIVAVCFAILLVSFLISERRKKREERMAEERVKKETENERPGFVMIIAIYLRAKKQKICPTIMLVNPVRKGSMTNA